MVMCSLIFVNCNHFLSNVAMGVEDVAFRSKHIVMICNTNESPEKERFFLNSLLSEKVSGAIIVPTVGNGNANFYQKSVEENFPMVMVDRRVKNLNVRSVSIHNSVGGYQAEIGRAHV